MTTKLIERYVIMEEDVVIETVDDMRILHNPKLKVFDRKFNEVIAVLSNGDKDETFIMARSVIDAINNYPEDDVGSTSDDNLEDIIDG